ncbi:hypothetical protein O9G_000073 [Rozella allomycis CSF55]|uniref:Sm domain-containing protein n=1 Tax=Rozella allomycis (strain CSF55) TaxID=988480 RepID=A0A075ANX4_ROZAC|nr:hypothetical protein O9G_000073 [Rozella allomycis CSF55]|eukprot:EPZ31594.1 hypothetical protein O9G_000073 [Rozella allomycis CSF55]
MATKLELSFQAKNLTYLFSSILGEKVYVELNREQIVYGTLVFIDKSQTMVVENATWIKKVNDVDWEEKVYESMVIQGPWIRYIQFDKSIDFDERIKEMEERRKRASLMYSRGKVPKISV